jgi:hypothetical protein
MSETTIAYNSNGVFILSPAPPGGSGGGLLMANDKALSDAIDLKLPKTGGTISSNLIVSGTLAVTGTTTLSNTLNLSNNNITNVGSISATTLLGSLSASNLTGTISTSLLPTLIVLTPMTAPTGAQKGIYVDTADNKLKYRGASGTVTVLALP